MTKTLKKLSGIALLSIAFSSAYALPNADINPQPYAGFDAAYNKYDESGLKNGHYSTLGVHAGAKLNPYLAIEGRFNIGLNKAKINDSIDGVDLHAKLKQKYAVSAFIKPMLPINEQAEVYGLLGITHIKRELKGTVNVSGSTGSFRDTDSGRDFSWGLGGEYRFEPNTGVSLEYMSLYDKHDVEVSSFNLGLNFYF